MDIATKDKHNAQITVNISDEVLKNLLCSACEGGSNYWIDHADVIPVEKRDPRVEYWHEAPVYGQTFTLYVSEDAPVGKEKVVVDRASLEKGMKIMAEKYPHHFADILIENDDAITADVFLQCCCFDDAIYG